MISTFTDLIRLRRCERGDPRPPEALLQVGPEPDSPPAWQRSCRHPGGAQGHPPPAGPALAGHGGDEQEVLGQCEEPDAHRLPAGGVLPGPGALAHEAHRPVAGAGTAAARARAVRSCRGSCVTPRPWAGIPTRSARSRSAIPSLRHGRGHAGRGREGGAHYPCRLEPGRGRPSRAGPSSAWNRSAQAVTLLAARAPAAGFAAGADHGLSRQPGAARPVPGAEPQGPGAGHRRPVPDRLHHPGLGPGGLRRPGRAADLAGDAGAARPPRAGTPLPLRPRRWAGDPADRAAAYRAPEGRRPCRPARPGPRPAGPDAGPRPAR